MRGASEQRCRKRSTLHWAGPWHDIDILVCVCAYALIQYGGCPYTVTHTVCVGTDTLWDRPHQRSSLPRMRHLEQVQNSCFVGAIFQTVILDEECMSLSHTWCPSRLTKPNRWLIRDPIRENGAPFWIPGTSKEMPSRPIDSLACWWSQTVRCPSWAEGAVETCVKSALQKLWMRGQDSAQTVKCRGAKQWSADILTQPPRFQCSSSQCALHCLRPIEVWRAIVWLLGIATNAFWVEVLKRAVALSASLGLTQIDRMRAALLVKQVCFRWECKWC